MKVIKKLALLLTLVLMLQNVFIYQTVYAESPGKEQEQKDVSSYLPTTDTQSESNPSIKSIDLKDSMTDLNEKQPKTVLEAENPELLKREKQFKNSPDNAPEILANTVYSTSLLGTNDAIWVKINTDNYKKLTTVVQFQTNMDFSIDVYQLDASYVLHHVEGTDVNLLFADTDRVSFLPQGGFYYIEITSLGGSGDFNFLLQSSSSYSSHEPNDNYFQAPQFQTEINTSDTFDSLYDDDWYKLSVPTSQTYYFSVNMREEPFGESVPIHLYIIDLTNGGVTLLKETTPCWYSVNLQKGEYAFSITSATTASLNREYIFNMLPSNSSKFPSEVYIQKIGNHPDTAYILDSVWRVMGGSMVVYGRVSGPGGWVGNIPIQLKVTAYNILFGVKEIKVANTVTDENGDYRLTMSLPYCDGIYSGTSNWHYDINDIDFYDIGGNKIYCQQSEIYNSKTY